MQEVENVAKLGIAIACHNNLDVLKQTLDSVYSIDFTIVVFDDGSTDGTYQYITKNFPFVIYLNGDGTNWWTGSIAKAISECFRMGCEYVISLNADVILSSSDAIKLVKYANNLPNSIIAALVVKSDNTNLIAWGGSKFDKLHKFLPIYSSRYIHKSGTDVSSLNNVPYNTDELHGRGVLISKSVYELIGNYDYKKFPHYGADTEYSFRAKKNAVKLWILPSIKAKLFVENSGMISNDKNLISKINNTFKYLFKRKNGEALRIWWLLLKRYVPFYAVIPSYIFIISLNIYRKLTK